MNDKQGKYGELIQKARKTESQIAGKPEETEVNPESSATREKPKEVNLSIKVSESLRRHWAAEAKRQGISVTSVIIEALTARFGIPPE